jgi:hypothetical protein
MHNIFCGKLREDDLTKDFLNSKDLQIRKFKHAILDSARLALHISVDQMILYDLDIPEMNDLKQKI